MALVGFFFATQQPGIPLNMSNDPREQQKRRRIEIGSQYFHQHTYFLHRYIVRPCAETRAPLFELMRQYEAEVAAGMVEPVEFV